MNRQALLCIPLIVGTDVFALSRVPASEHIVRAEEICREERLPAMKALTTAMAAYNQALHQKKDRLESFVLTDERKAKVREIFLQAQGAHLSYLKRAARLAPSDHWEEVIELIAKVQLRQEIRGPGSSSPEFGARLLPSENGKPAEVLVPGITLVVDYAPEILLFLLLHEISHAVDPGVFPVPMKAAGGSVFDAVVRCLRSPQSVKARVGDPSCFARSAEKKKEKTHLKEAAKFCLRMSEGLSTNPDFSLSGPGCDCEAAQGAEAFADWLGAEALAGMDATKITPAATLGWICATYVEKSKRDEEIAKLPGGDKMLESMRLLATHPALRDRIERILLSQPTLLKSIFSGKDAPAQYCPLSNVFPPAVD